MAWSLCGYLKLVNVLEKQGTYVGTGQSQWPLPATSRADPRQGLPQDQVQESDHQGSRPEAENSVGLGLNQVPLMEQAQASDLCWSRPLQMISAGAGMREWLPRKQARAKDLCRTEPKPETSVGGDPSQGHLREHPLARDLYWRPEPMTSAGAGTSQQPQWEQPQASYLPGTRPEWPLELQSKAQECWVAFRVTGTMALTAPWRTTI